MKSVKDFHFFNGWKKLSLGDQLMLKDFWRSRNLMTDDDIEKRVHQAVVLIKNRDNNIVGVSTVFRTYFEQLKSEVYVYRCYIDPKFRAPGLDVMLTIKTKEFLESELRKMDGVVPVGLLAVIQNESMIRNWTKAIWPDVDMVYIGDTPEGYHLRISYFMHAKINL